MTITLWRDEDPQTGVTLMNIGDGVVLECPPGGPPRPHYLGGRVEADEFVIRQAYALLSMGYRVIS